MQNTPIAVIGAGLIGRTHIDRALKASGVELAAIADPPATDRRLAESVNVKWFADAGTPLIALNELISVPTPASTAALNGGK